MTSEFRRVSDMLFHPGIGSLELRQLPAADVPIQMLSISADYGGMPAQDLYALLRIVQWLQPRRIFELGTFQGTTTAHLALNSAAEIYTLDLPRELASDLQGYAARDLALLQMRAEIGTAYSPFNSDGRIHQLFADSRSFDYQPYSGTMDLVLIDACHVLEYVMSDSQNAFRLLSEKGAILWHDFGNSRDVMRVLRKLAKKSPIADLEGTALALYSRTVPLPKESGESIGVSTAQGA